MLAFPNAKLNLGLKVLGRRPDNFHDIETVFLPVDLCDVLEIIVAGDHRFSFTSSGMEIPGDAEQNLCVQAYRILLAQYGIPPVKIHLHKIIPTGGGLGGGSSDGAFALKLLNRMFSLELSGEELMGYASKLGSDCSFFIRNIPAFADGRGEELRGIKMDLSSFIFVIAVPEMGVSTKEAYAWIDQHSGDTGLSGEHHPFFSGTLGIEQWNSTLQNDFEAPVFSRYPGIQKIKETMYERGAVYASMSGSGSAVFGIFMPGSSFSEEFENCRVFKTKML
jgi:4-diphosphocytidyl-2-C-methyl-D-erythritol kinase